ncbi:hypothetical protein TNCV_2469511 [Trichonephila clavipes]|nr:hypothetical protein TNCV_2469511 [Trichonephila clavipes]
MCRSGGKVHLEKTTQLVGRNETTQLCTCRQPPQPPATAYNRLQPPTTACNRLRPPTTACNRLQPPAPPATAYNRLQPPATAYKRLQPPAPPAPPLQQNRLFLPTGVSISAAEVQEIVDLSKAINSDSEAKIDNEIFKIVTFSDALYCSESVKT